jgi:hypothetical protein
MDNDKASLGKASLGSSIIGIVLPGCLYVLVAMCLRPPGEQGWAYGICELLFVILELVALGCGIAARRTPTGKAGLAISGSLLLLGLIFISAVVLYFSFFFIDR